MNSATTFWVCLEGETQWASMTAGELVGECEAHGLVPSYVTRVLADCTGDAVVEIGPYLVAAVDLNGAEVLRITEDGEEERYATLRSFVADNEEDEETVAKVSNLCVGDTARVGFGFRIERVL